MDRLMRVLRTDKSSPYQQLVGVGGLGTGIFFSLEGDHTLGRNESRMGGLLEVRDYCKLHIVIHYVAKLLGASSTLFQVLPVGKVGNDAAGEFVLREMKSVGIDTRFVETIAGKPTLFSVCFQYPDGTGGNITTSNSAAASLCKRDLDGIERLLTSAGPKTIALLLPEVPLEVRREFLKLATRAGAFRAASFVSGEIAAAKESAMFEQLDLVSLNQGEAGQLIGDVYSPANPDEFVTQAVRYVRSSCPQLQMVVSTGKGGAYAVNHDGWNYCPAPQVEVASTAGAGDCLLGGVLAAMATGVPLLNSGPPRKSLTERPINTALEFGVVLASYKVTSHHTIHPDASLATVVDFAAQRGIIFDPLIVQRFADAEDPTEQLSSSGSVSHDSF
jgi:sugar/nucleoside kinase (ribokinase family)